MDNTTHLIRIPNMENHNCFGCSTENQFGLHLQFFTDGEHILAFPEVPPHLCGWENIIHGGITATILDEIMGWSVLYLLKKFPMTKTMTVDYLKPLYIGEKLKVVGSVIHIQTDREARIRGELYNQNQELCARAEGIFATFPPKVLQKMGVVRPEMAAEFERIIQQRER